MFAFAIVAASLGVSGPSSAQDYTLDNDADPQSHRFYLRIVGSPSLPGQIPIEVTRVDARGRRSFFGGVAVEGVRGFFCPPFADPNSGSPGDYTKPYVVRMNLLKTVQFKSSSELRALLDQVDASTSRFERLTLLFGTPRGYNPNNLYGLDYSYLDNGQVGHAADYGSSPQYPDPRFDNAFQALSMGQTYDIHVMDECLTLDQVDQMISVAKNAVGAVIFRLEHPQPGGAQTQ
jgi:hypothetical protein